ASGTPPCKTDSFAKKPILTWRVSRCRFAAVPLSSGDSTPLDIRESRPLKREPDRAKHQWRAAGGTSHEVHFIQKLIRSFSLLPPKDLGCRAIPSLKRTMEGSRFGIT